MTLKQCLENLKRDIADDGIRDDTSAVIWYITMANEARRLLGSKPLDQRTVDDAKQYLTLCCDSGSDALRRAAED